MSKTIKVAEGQTIGFAVTPTAAYLAAVPAVGDDVQMSGAADYEVGPSVDGGLSVGRVSAVEVAASNKAYSLTVETDGRLVESVADEVLAPGDGIVKTGANAVRLYLPGVDDASLFVGVAVTNAILADAVRYIER